MLLTAVGLGGGCAARTVPAGGDVEPFVGKSVRIDGTVERSAIVMPATRWDGNFCLTLPPGRRFMPVQEMTLQHGQARIAFASANTDRTLAVGDPVRVTGRLRRTSTAGTVADGAARYELVDARWEAIRQ